MESRDRVRRLAVASFGLATALWLAPATAAAAGMADGLGHLQRARANLSQSADNKGGHKDKALERIGEAIREVEADMHRGDRDGDKKLGGDKKNDGGAKQKAMNLGDDTGKKGKNK
jgi:hypothetical protein